VRSLQAWDTEETAMSSLPIDVDTRVSAGLSELIESRVNDPNADQPVTLSSIRAFITRELPPDIRETDRLHHLDSTGSLLAEIDALIEEYGEEAPAFDFVQARASEELSRVIEAVMDDENRENPPSLGTVKEAMVGGLVARLVGEGVLEDDEDETLVGEIDGLIERFGADMPAEGFLRYE
jgi:hypothetical protein